MRGSQLNLNRGISWDSRVSRRWRGPLSVAHSKRRGNAIERFVVDVADSKLLFLPRITWRSCTLSPFGLHSSRPSDRQCLLFV